MCRFNACLAQLVEQFVANEQVAGSNPVARTKNMYKIIDSQGFVRGQTKDLYLALEMAKYVDEFVVITDGTTEIVGKFGVDAIVNGLCPDGVAYDWNKASRIGAPKRNAGKVFTDTHESSKLE